MIERDNFYLDYISITLAILLFYAPNILQTLLITLYWPINFYFVKSYVFILVLSLTRNLSYFTDEVPDDFLATSTTITQYWIHWKITSIREISMFNNQKQIIKVIKRINSI